MIKRLAASVVVAASIAIAGTLHAATLMSVAYGTITGVRERTLMLKVADNVEFEIARAAIATVQGKETPDS